MDNDIQYFNAVIDTSNLIKIWLKNKNEDINKILSNLEINLEAKYGPFTSKLSNQIGVNETLGLKNPDSYWKGVKDTLVLLKNFLAWKNVAHSSRSIDNFLMEIVNKSNVRIEPDESPLITALGILFEQDFPDHSPSAYDSNLYESPKTEVQEPVVNFAPQVEPVISEVKPEQQPLESEVHQEPAREPEIPDISSYEPSPSIDLPSVQESNFPEEDKAFDPNEFIDDEKFLDQFIADSINPEESTQKSDEDIVSSERDYLRAALEELSITPDENEEEKEIEIQFKGPSFNEPEKANEEPKTTSIIEEALEEKDQSRLLSSSLRDALRMLREED